MNEMIERVAKAIAITGNGGTWDDWYNEEQREFHRKRAKAAIDAMINPTRSMVNAAWIDYEHSPDGVLVRESSTFHARADQYLEDDTAYEVWQAMIKEAMKCS